MAQNNVIDVKSSDSSPNIMVADEDDDGFDPNDFKEDDEYDLINTIGFDSNMIAAGGD